MKQRRQVFMEITIKADVEDDEMFTPIVAQALRDHAERLDAREIGNEVEGRETYTVGAAEVELNYQARVAAAA